jgi:hypothetical protein
VNLTREGGADFRVGVTDLFEGLGTVSFCRCAKGRADLLFST